MLHFSCFLFMLGLLPVASVGAEAIVLPRVKPLVEFPETWDFNEYWVQKTIGPKDFYFSAQPWAFMDEKSRRELMENGILGLITPQVLGLNCFDPAYHDQLAPHEKYVRDFLLKERYPFWSCNYSHIAEFMKRRPLTEECFKQAGELWLGDGHAEELYRPEPFFNYLTKSKEYLAKGGGSATLSASISSGYSDQEYRFMDEVMAPALDKRVPFWRDRKHVWTYEEFDRFMRAASDIRYAKDRHVTLATAEIGDVRCYYEASRPENRCVVAGKDSSCRTFAFARSMARQFGGGKFVMSAIGFEPGLSLFEGIQTGQNKLFQNGYPFWMARQYYFATYLRGAHMFYEEIFPGPCLVPGSENKRTLGALGEVVMEMKDFIERHPRRGVVYAPIALLKDWNYHEWYDGLPEKNRISKPRSSHAADAIEELIWHNPPSCIFLLNYIKAAPFGELFDVLRPNIPADVRPNGIDEKTLANYKVLFAMPGLPIDKRLADKIVKHVQNGGTFVVQAEDLKDRFATDFSGVQVEDREVKVNEVVSKESGATFRENTFTARGMKTAKGKAAYESKEGLPIVSVNQVGKGQVVVINAGCMIPDEIGKKPYIGGTYLPGYACLKFSKDFFRRLVAGTTPVEVRMPEGAEESICYQVSKKGESWLVTVFNYSLERDIKYDNTRNYVGLGLSYPPKEIPLEIACKGNIGDVAEWFGDRSARWSMENGVATVKEGIPSGEMRVYEFAPKKIDFGATEVFVNHAEGKPCKASSFEEGHEPRKAVDGAVDIPERGWWSKWDYTEREKNLPQWIEVDLQAVKTVNHVAIHFFYWPREGMDELHHVNRYYVEVSEDGKEYRKVVDMTDNFILTRAAPRRHWFEPAQARYVRVTVTYASDRHGARIREIEVRGTEKELVRIARDVLPGSPRFIPVVPRKRVAAELLKNADFEAGTEPAPTKGSEMPEGWRVNWGYVGLTKVVQDPSVAHSGKQCLMLQYQADPVHKPQYRCLSIMCDKVEVSPIEKYRFQIWVKGGAIGKPFGVAVCEYNRIQRNVGYVPLVPLSEVALSDRWQLFEAVYQPKSPEVDQVLVMIDSENENTDPLWLDDASLKVWDEQPSAAGQ